MASSTWRVNNSTALGGEVCSQWQANHAYATGARCVCRVAYGTVAARAFVYEVTDDGTSHATTEPTWPTTVGNTVSDGTVTWTCRSPSDGSWDNASCYLQYILNHTAIAAGDFVYIDDGHDESQDWSWTRLVLKGSTTYSNPIKIVCVDKDDDSLSTGAVVTSTNASYGIYIKYAGYSYGVQYETPTSFGANDVSAWTFEGNNTTVLNVGYLGAGSTCRVRIINGNIGVTGGHALNSGVGYFNWRGGVLTSAPSLYLILSYPVTGKITLEDVDLSALGNLPIMKADNASYFDVTMIRCKMPETYSYHWGAPSWYAAGTGRLIMHHCSSANNTYSLHEDCYEGTIDHNTTIVRTGGASDGTTALSLKMVSSSNVVDNYNPLSSPSINSWTNSTTSKTFTIEGVWDSATNIQDDEIWMEFEYPANNTDGLGAIAKDKCAILGTPADQTASTETWTGTGGFSNENKFKLSVTVTPGKAGPITAKVYLAKPSTTVYIDPKITEN